MDSQRRTGRSRWLLPLGIFALALLLRLLFWQATPDRSWPYSAWYKGDAATWLEYANAINADQPFELGLPIRPPGQARLLALLWNGQPSSIPALRAIWCLIGASTVLLLFLAVRRSFGAALALPFGLLAAAATGLMLLASSLNNETPYLLLVAATLWQWPLLQRGPLLHQQPQTGQLLLWGTLHSLACLVRVEHVLFFAAATVALMLCWWRVAPAGSRKRRAVAQAAVIVTATAIVVLTPWHLVAWSAIHRFNTVPPPSTTRSETLARQLERSLPALQWQPEALLARRALPAFCRQTAATFVAATVAHRGRRQVTGEDLSILEQAFGSRPEPLGRFPFVVLYGGLNFHLANNQSADGGFALTALDKPPPLIGGPGRYPAMLVQGLPPRDLTFSYPPHLAIINHGYQMGWRWLGSNPGAAIRLMAAKLKHFWAGASLGLGGENLPLGLGGQRRRADLVVPTGGLGLGLWQVLLLVLCIAGVVIGGRSLALLPWILLLASKVVTAMLFFGYARLGATVIPVVLLLICLAGSALARRVAPTAARSRMRAWIPALVLAAALVVLELLRLLHGPAVLIDGRPITHGDPFPVSAHEDRTITVQRAHPG